MSTEAVPSPRALAGGVLSEAASWYAMRATYRREMSVKQKLDEAGFTSFLPLVRKAERVGRRVRHTLEPAVSGLIFVRSRAAALQRFKETRPELQYITSRREGRGVKIVVPERQMEDFMALFESEGGGARLLPPQDAPMRPGQRVRVTAGPLAGREGYFRRVKGSRERRFVIVIPDVLCAVSALVRPDQVAPLDD